jgi:fructose/tagatose bisphosphate aldolase
MVDMSHYEKEENLQLTKELTEYCHARGIITEAEPGRINGGEDGVAVSVPSRDRYHATWVSSTMNTNMQFLGHRRAGGHPHHP